MAIFETFSKRQKRLARAGTEDVYTYDQIPEPFRIKVIHIWNSALGAFYTPGSFSRRAASPANKLWILLRDILRRERGVFQLAGNVMSQPDEECKAYVCEADTSGVLDIVELSFRIIDRGVRDLGLSDRQMANITQEPDDAIEEVNHRFQEHGLGYQYTDGYIIRLDSQFIHSEAVKPALSLLSDVGFDGPADEFIRAFEHQRHGRNKEAIAEALKAFESTMKAICAARNWPHQANATAKPLLDVLFKNGLIPAELETHFGALRSAMESGLPTLSNKTSRHGQGPVPTMIPDHVAAYALHLAASNIVFLVRAHKALK